MKSKDPLLNFSHLVDFGEHDNSEIARAILPRTGEKYDRALDIFDKFISLHPQAINPPNIKTYKAFLEFAARGMKGRIEEKPTIGTVESFRRDFEAGMSLRRKYNFSTEVSTTLREWIIQGLKEKISLSTDEMDKDGLSPNDLTVLMTQLWCRDFHEFRGEIPDRTRVQLSAAILLYCFTSARTGEVHESTCRRKVSREQGTVKEDKELEARVMAACYKHFILSIENVDGQSVLVLTYQREFVKGHWRKKRWELPIHAFYEIYREEVPLFFNLLTFFLPMASADDAFRDFSSISEILNTAEAYTNTSPTKNEVLQVIVFKEHVQEVPVFRPFSEQHVNKSTGKARGADAFGKEFVGLGHRSGFIRNHSESARMKFAGQSNRDTYGKYYAHPLSEVDGPATYLGIESRHGHIQNRRGMGIYQNPQLLQSLPAKAEFEFEDRDDVRALNRDMDSLSSLLPFTNDHEQKREIQVKQHQIYNEKQRLYKEELKMVQMLQPNTLMRSSGHPGDLHEQNLFHYRRRVMPERDLLATVLPQRVSLRSCQGRQALEALESLCKEIRPVAYRSGLQPVDGKCPCGEGMDKLVPLIIDNDSTLTISVSILIEDGYTFIVVIKLNSAI
ncbi:hypothetical protein N7474_010093 [Penicillium riverlandense]|uniref:uncharacterized protein n=1 Tax=Penicillium riverlandense TaxID=1903569 RepID=UPI00254896B0|nr:uncharacterized protein N7474_010093 [Penicillium riverlandense]KAJ5808824.1 hypothetical protein N7474_010093 [Penicillium riverlandense]